MEDLYNSTNSKSLDTYCGFAPKKVTRGKDAFLYDETRREFLDLGMALGSVSLGYGNDEVDEYVIAALRKGVNYSRPSYLEEELVNILQAKLEMPLLARFSKSSSMLLNIMPRVCRFLTNKRYISYPINGAYLGNTDWYLSHNIKSGGILQELRETTLTFTSGCLTSVRKLFEDHSKDLACIIMEPFRETIHPEDYYKELRYLCSHHNVLLVFDETVSGFRFAYPLAQKLIDCAPDFTIISKAFANGYALAAVVGQEARIYEVIEACKDTLFDFSTTHAGESVGLAAAIKTIQIIERDNVIGHIDKLGRNLMKFMNESIQRHNLENKLCLKGQPSYIQLAAPNGWLDNQIKKFIMKHHYDRGMLYRGITSLSFSHKEEQITKIAQVFDDCCEILSKQTIS